MEKRIRELDVLRVVAMLFVITYHFGCEYAAAGIPFFNLFYLTPNYDFGNIAVTIFIALSGGLLYKKYGVVQDIKPFYLKRAKAIYPPFWILSLYIPLSMIRHLVAGGSVFFVGNPFSLLLTVVGIDGYFKIFGFNTYAFCGDWFVGAKETGGLFFTDVVQDVFSGQIGIMVGYPVYQNGELAAVVGADLYLDSMAEAVAAAAENGSFEFIVNRNGHVVFSPMKKGILQVKTNADDLRESENTELAEFIRNALNQNTDIQAVNIDGTDYYVTGAPIESVGWVLVSAVSKELTDQPAVLMEERYDGIQSDALASFTRLETHDHCSADHCRDPGNRCGADPGKTDRDPSGNDDQTGGLPGRGEPSIQNGACLPNR